MNRLKVKIIGDDIVEDRKTSGYSIISIFPFCQVIFTSVEIYIDLNFSKKFASLKNGNLQQELDLNQKRSIFIKNDRVLKLFRGVCNAINYIHESNLAHRDLKPQNILIGEYYFQIIAIDQSLDLQKYIIFTHFQPLFLGLKS